MQTEYKKIRPQLDEVTDDLQRCVVQLEIDIYEQADEIDRSLTNICSITNIAEEGDDEEYHTRYKTDLIDFCECEENYSIGGYVNEIENLLISLKTLEWQLKNHKKQLKPIAVKVSESVELTEAEVNKVLEMKKVF